VGIIGEEELICRLDRVRGALLLEPFYKRKYPPLGLAKIAAFLSARGAEWSYARSADVAIPGIETVLVTSLFTYESEAVHRALRKAASKYPGVPIIVGGIYASLMPDRILSEFPQADVFAGYSRILDSTPALLSHDWHTEAKWAGFSFVFTSRGCPNSCAYCAVKTIERDRWLNPEWARHIDPDRPRIMVSDNNLSATPEDWQESVARTLAESGKLVVFDNGFDCKLITNRLAGFLAKIRYEGHGLRMAFDRIAEDGVFQAAIERLISAGIPRSHIMAYVLFNFTDSPKEANYRMSECVRLGIRPYPQKFIPLNLLDERRPYVGKLWTRNLAARFRYFWLMAGLYTRQAFAEYMDRNPDKFMIADYDAWASGPEFGRA
jgi:hypothetical protein